MNLAQAQRCKLTQTGFKYNQLQPPRAQAHTETIPTVIIGKTIHGSHFLQYMTIAKVGHS